MTNTLAKDLAKLIVHISFFYVSICSLQQQVLFSLLKFIAKLTAIMLFLSTKLLNGDVFSLEGYFDYKSFILVSIKQRLYSYAEAFGLFRSFVNMY